MTRIFSIGIDQSVTSLLAVKGHEWFYGKGFFYGEEMGHDWKVPVFYNMDPRKKESDFYHIGVGNLLFSERVMASDFGVAIEDAGEILTAKVESGKTHKKIYFLNTLACYPCLDLENSEVDYSTSGKVLVRVIKHAFREERVLGSVVFKIPETIRTTVYTIERPGGVSLRRIVADNKFTGIEFKEVWAG